MIVCSCNILSCGDLRQGVEALLAEDLHAVLTPGKVYGCLGKRVKCGGCMPNSVDIIYAHAEKVRCERACSDGCSVCLLNHSNVRSDDRVSEAA